MIASAQLWRHSEDLYIVMDDMTFKKMFIK